MTTETAIPNLQSDEPAILPLDALHRQLGGKMVAFAGAMLPVHYSAGVLAEHHACRNNAALFDVSHMGQVSARGDVAALEKLLPADITGLPVGRQCYTVLPNEVGGIFDDLMVARYPDRITLVVNASRKLADVAHLATNLPEGVHLEGHEDRALLALQGPQAASALEAIAPGIATMRFMDALELPVDGVPCWITRSGYTGEDGFEISIPAHAAEQVATRILAQPGVQPAGLGARDSLRLEAGLPLYGTDLDELTSPVQASLTWTIARRRRQDCDFMGSVVIRDHIQHGPTRIRVGIRPEGPAPARAGTIISATDGTEAGSVTSGGFSPTLNAPIAMGYVRRGLEKPGTKLLLLIRGRQVPASVCALPFVPHRYAR